MAGNGLRARSWIRGAVASILLLKSQTTPAVGEAGGYPASPALACLAWNVYHESRGEPEIGQRAVADVTLNRVEDARWPNTVCAVVWQAWQFSWTMDHLSDEMGDTIALAQSYRIAWAALNTPRTTDATHYHNIMITPNWAKHYEVVEVIGLHVFYR